MGDGGKSAGQQNTKSEDDGHWARGWAIKTVSTDGLQFLTVHQEGGAKIVVSNNVAIKSNHLNSCKYFKCYTLTVHTEMLKKKVKIMVFKVFI